MFDLLLTRPLGSNISEIWIEMKNIFIQEQIFQNVICKMAAISGLNITSNTVFLDDPVSLSAGTSAGSMLTRLTTCMSIWAEYEKNSVYKYEKIKCIDATFKLSETTHLACVNDCGFATQVLNGQLVCESVFESTTQVCQWSTCYVVPWGSFH